MGPPRALFLRTDDGFDIAYTVMGDGPPLVLMPTPFGHLDNDWRWWKRSLFEALAARFRVAHYNSRGHGMSSRGLPHDFALADYLVDLEAVVKRARMDRYVLWGFPLFNYVGVLQALRAPEQVSALILHNCGAGRAWQWAEPYENMARDSWDEFLFSFGSAMNVLPNRDTSDAARGINQRDFLTVLAAAKSVPVYEEIACQLTVPTLIVVSSDRPHALDDGRRLAAVIPNATLVSVHPYGRDLFSDGPGPPPIVAIVEEFLAGLPDGATEDGPPSPIGATPSPALTHREVEVLRLVAEGKTNREIAETLVISERTVINHISSIFTKTGVENRAGAAAYAVRHGIA